MQHCYSTISSYGIFHIHIPYKFATSVYGKKAMAEVKDRYNSSAAAEVPQGAHGGEGSGRSGAGASGEPGRKCCRVFFWGDVRTHGKGVEKEGQMDFDTKKRICHIYVYIYIMNLFLCLIVLTIQNGVES
jgi:hypothetical protein